MTKHLFIIALVATLALYAVGMGLWLIHDKASYDKYGDLAETGCCIFLVVEAVAVLWFFPEARL